LLLELAVHSVLMSLVKLLCKYRCRGRDDDPAYFNLRVRM
jgi:hypothetical protein